MGVVLGGILNITAIIGGGLLGSRGIKVDILDVVVGIVLVYEHYEECCRSRP